ILGTDIESQRLDWNQVGKKLLSGTVLSNANDVTIELSSIQYELKTQIELQMLLKTGIKIPYIPTLLPSEGFTLLDYTFGPYDLPLQYDIQFINQDIEIDLMSGAQLDGSNIDIVILDNENHITPTIDINDKGGYYDIVIGTNAGTSLLYSYNEIFGFSTDNPAIYDLLPSFLQDLISSEGLSVSASISPDFGVNFNLGTELLFDLIHPKIIENGDEIEIILSLDEASLQALFEIWASITVDFSIQIKLIELLEWAEDLLPDPLSKFLISSVVYALTQLRNTADEITTIINTLTEIASSSVNEIASLLVNLISSGNDDLSYVIDGLVEVADLLPDGFIPESLINFFLSLKSGLTSLEQIIMAISSSSVDIFHTIQGFTLSLLDMISADGFELQWSHTFNLIDREAHSYEMVRALPIGSQQYDLRYDLIDFSNYDSDLAQSLNIMRETIIDLTTYDFAFTIIPTPVTVDALFELDIIPSMTVDGSVHTRVTSDSIVGGLDQEISFADTNEQAIISGIVRTDIDKFSIILEDIYYEFIWGINIKPDLKLSIEIPLIPDIPLLEITSLLGIEGLVYESAPIRFTTCDIMVTLPLTKTIAQIDETDFHISYIPLIQL
ncbi:MAG: hypothetical protein ACTSPO_16115, partial [Candidatus Heimdallarchaeaceae archaeon]